MTTLVLIALWFLLSVGAGLLIGRGIYALNGAEELELPPEATPGLSRQVGDTRPGVDGRDASSVHVHTAKKTGQSERAIQRRGGKKQLPEPREIVTIIN